MQLRRGNIQMHECGDLKIIEGEPKTPKDNLMNGNG